jgi:hypothetical protein
MDRFRAIGNASFVAEYGVNGATADAFVAETGGSVAVAITDIAEATYCAAFYLIWSGLVHGTWRHLPPLAMNAARSVTFPENSETNLSDNVTKAGCLSRIARKLRR